MSEPIAQPTEQPRPERASVMKNSGISTSFLVAAIIWAAIIVALLILTDWQFYIQWLVAGSATTLLFFILDRIQKSRWSRRIPEALLLVLCLAGGVLGGWVGALLFRHKLKQFLVLLTLIVATVIHGYLFWRFVID